MRGPKRAAAGLLGAVLLPACTTTQMPDRYAAGYDACDREVGACYEACSVERREDDRRACQDQCSRRANQCFARVSQNAERESLWRARRDYVFYGRYGFWSPHQGYRYGPHGRRYSYDPYGYAYPRDPYGYAYGYGWTRGRGGIATRDDPHDCQRRTRSPRCHDGGRDGGNDADTPHEPALVETPDGSVYTEDGKRLRYGGKPQPRPRPQLSNGARPTGRSGNPTIEPERVVPPSRPAKPRAIKPDPRPRPTAKPRSEPRPVLRRPKPGTEVP